MRLGKWTALWPPLIVVAAWTGFAEAQSVAGQVVEARAARTTADTAIEMGAPNRMILASGILTFGSTEGSGGVPATSDLDADAHSRTRQTLGPFAIIDSLFILDSGAAVYRSRSSLPKPTIHVSPAAIGAGGYGMLAIGTF